jgi:hypothetical protein
MWGNTMKAKVNLQLLKTTTFDSGALGMLTMVLHQFRSDGHYQAAIMQQGLAVTDVDFEVDEKSEMMQLNIDLAQTVRKSKARPEDCCFKSEKQPVGVVSPKGYVLFHASSGDGYSVTVSNTEGKVVFDSTKLGDGDLFAVSLLEPGKYSMANTIGSVEGEIVVSLAPEAAKRISTLETLHIDMGEKETKHIEVTSSQGLVFHIKDSARILIERGYAPPQKPGKPVIRWQKLQIAKKKTKEQ